MQLFFNFGVSESISVLARSVGAGLGAFAYRRNWMEPAGGESFTPRRLRLLALVIAPIYVIALIAIQNWHFYSWSTWETGLARLTQIHFLPFYHHYFTTETAAL